MYLREPFAVSDISRVAEFIRVCSFATLVTTDRNNLPLASHLPVDIVPAEGSDYGMVITHLASKNPHLPLLVEQRPSLILFLSDSAYISPSWFSNRNSAPTQSHIAVHAFGSPSLVSDAERKKSLIALQVARREQGRTNAWNITELDTAGLERRLNAISVFEIPITRVEASFRLLQDEPLENINAALDSGNIPAALDQQIRKTLE